MLSTTDCSLLAGGEAAKAKSCVKLMITIVGMCGVIAVLSASLEALNAASIKRIAMSTDRTYSIEQETFKENRLNGSGALPPGLEPDHETPSAASIQEGQGMYNSTPSGWWPTKEWLEQCAKEETAIQLETKKMFQMPPGWYAYRLGDCIKMCHACGNFSGSLASVYSEKACQEDNYQNKIGGNKAIIDEVLRLRDGVAGFQKPGDDSMIIHLRLGDVVENSNDDVATMLVKGGVPEQSVVFVNVTGIKSAYELLSNAREAGVPKVTIIGGSHKNVRPTKSLPYAECLRKTFETAGYEVSLEVNSATPDQDFYRLSHAKHIVVSSGGYSRLVGRNAERHGGKIYGRFFEKAR